MRDHPYITSAKRLGGWVQDIFADIQYYLCWRGVGVSEKTQKYDDVV